MKKLKLNLENLKVESFETQPKKNTKGTVLGNTTYQTYDNDNCQSMPCTTHVENLCTWNCHGGTADITCVDECPETTYCGGGGTGQVGNTEHCTLQVTCPNTCGEDG